MLVRCFTYNQSKYIEDALNGFAMQQTNFPFVCLVMDDCSTDGEQEVIKAWMQRECDMEKSEVIEIPTSVVFIVPHKTNTSCSFAFYLFSFDTMRLRRQYLVHLCLIWNCDEAKSTRLLYCYNMIHLLVVLSIMITQSRISQYCWKYELISSINYNCEITFIECCWNSS